MFCAKHGICCHVTDLEFFPRFFALTFHLSLFLIYFFFSAKTTYMGESQGYWIGPMFSEHN